MERRDRKCGRVGETITGGGHGHNASHIFMKLSKIQE